MAQESDTTSDEPNPLNPLAQKIRAIAKQHDAAILLVLQRRYETAVVIDLAAPWNAIRHHGDEIRVKTDTHATEAHKRDAVTASVAVILAMEDVTARVAETMRALKLNASRSFKSVHRLRVVEDHDDEAEAET